MLFDPNVIGLMDPKRMDALQQELEELNQQTCALEQSIATVKAKARRILDEIETYHDTIAGLKNPSFEQVSKYLEETPREKLVVLRHIGPTFDPDRRQVKYVSGRCISIEVPYDTSGDHWITLDMTWNDVRRRFELFRECYISFPTLTSPPSKQ